MAGANITNFAILQTHYLKDIVNTLNNTSKLRMLCSKNPYSWTGDHIEFPINLGRNIGIGAIQDGGAYPAAGKQLHQFAKAYRKFVVASVQLTEGLLATASDSVGSAKSALAIETEGIMRDVRKFENGMLFRDGSGKIATINGNSTSATQAVDDARMLWDGLTCEAYDSAGTYLQDVTISKTWQGGVLSSAATSTAGNKACIVLSASYNPAYTGSADDYLVWPGAADNCITGLDKLIDDGTAGTYPTVSGTFQNVNMATYPRYSSYVNSNGGTARDLTPTIFRQALAAISSKTGADVPINGLQVLCSVWDAISVEELFEGQLRLNPQDSVAGLATSSFQSFLGRIDVMPDADCPYGKMFLVDFKQIVRAVQKELDWVRDGSNILRPSHTSAVRTGVLFEASELFIKERGACAKIEDLNFSLGTGY
jgi:hypothetical protein